MSERCFVLVDFTHMSSTRCLRVYEAGETYTMPRAIAHAAAKRGLVAKQRPADWTPPSILRSPEGIDRGRCCRGRKGIAGSATSFPRGSQAEGRQLPHKACAPGSPPRSRGSRSPTKSTHRALSETRSLSECSSRPFTRRILDSGQLLRA